MGASTAADVRQHILETAKPIMLCKGFSGVGLNEILQAAGVPKGSFYHYFGSKEAFGEALLASYFGDYVARIDGLLNGAPGSGAERLMRYWANWRDTECKADMQGQCLAVKLGPEVCDWSPVMQTALQRGTAQIIQRLARCIEEGVRDGSLRDITDATGTATTLYQLWLGATLLAKFRHSSEPLELAMDATRRLLALP